MSPKDAPHLARPELRDDLIVEAQPNGGVILRDPVCEKAHHLSPAAATIARNLNGQVTVELLADHFELSIDDARAFIRGLDAQHLLITPNLAEDLVQLAAERQTEREITMGLFTVSPNTTPESDDDIEIRQALRFDCQACGACCTNRFRVQLVGDDYERLLSLDPEPLGIAHFDDVITVSFPAGRPLSEPQQYLDKRKDGRCVFLEDDNLCAIHRHYGLEAKPTACQIFPYYPMATPRGVLIQFRPESSRHYITYRTGELAAERKREIWDSISHPFDNLLTIPERFDLTPGTLVDFDAYRELERQWMQRIEAESWRVLPDIGRELGATATQDDFDAVYTALYQRLRNIQRDAPWEGLNALFYHLLDDTYDPMLAPCFLLADGIAPPDLSEEAMRDMRPMGEIVARYVAAYDNDEANALLTEYALNAISSRYIFHAMSIISGLGLLRLAIHSALRGAAYVCALNDTPADLRVLHEAMIALHQYVLSNEVTRLHLEKHFSEPLSRIVAA